jgi:hypothetical protein
MDTLQAPVPEQSPPQPVKVEPFTVVAVKVTGVLAGNAALQVVPQLIPVGLLTTAPLPVRETDSV